MSCSHNPSLSRWGDSFLGPLNVRAAFDKETDISVTCRNMYKTWGNEHLKRGESPGLLFE
jgi:hypothetical protein